MHRKEADTKVSRGTERVLKGTEREIRGGERERGKERTRK